MMTELPIIPDEESGWCIAQQISDLKERDTLLEHIFSSYEDGATLDSAIDYAAKFFRGVGWPELEEKIRHFPLKSYTYSRHVTGRRFPAGEAAIARDSYSAFEYAKDIIGGRWIKGEKAISKSGILSYWYAVQVIGGRFIQGEPAIHNHLEFTLRYNNFLAEINDKRSHNSR